MIATPGTTSEVEAQRRPEPEATGRGMSRAVRRKAAPTAVLAAEGACIRRAVTQEDLVDAYRFLCGIRVALGYPAPQASVLWADPAEGVREMATFIARSWPDVVATTTLVLDSTEPELPADRVFPELGELRERGRFVAELTNRATVPAYLRTDVPGALLRCCVAHGLYIGCSDLVAVIRPWEQASFEALGFRRMGSVRSSGGSVPEPVMLARLDLLMLQEGCSLTGPSMEAGYPLLWQFYLKASPYPRHVRAWAALVEQEARAGRIRFVEAPDLSEDDRLELSEALRAAA